MLLKSFIISQLEFKEHGVLRAGEDIHGLAPSDNIFLVLRLLPYLVSINRLTSGDKQVSLILFMSENAQETANVVLITQQQCNEWQQKYIRPIRKSN